MTTAIAPPPPSDAGARAGRVSVRAVVTISLALTMSVLDGAIANIALPSIAAAFHVTPADSIWVVNAYQLAVLVLLLPLGALGEILGYRRIYLLGLVVFTAASLACAFAPNLPTLAFARMIQGLGAAGIMSVNAGLLRVIYPPGQLGRGVGVNALVVALAAALGPTIASGLLAIGPWPILFAVNVPIGLATLLIGRGALPETAKAQRRFDWLSAVLNGAVLALLVTAIDGLGRRQVGMVAVQFAVAGLMLVTLVARQRGRTAPLLPLDLLGIPVFRLSVIASVLGFAAATAALVSLPFWFQHQLGYSPVATGLLMTPWPLALAVIAPVAGSLADRHSPGLLGTGGLALVAAGLILLAVVGGTHGLPVLGLELALCGAGFGLFQAPNNRAMLGAAPADRGGAAGGLLSTARLLGQSLGAALAAVSLALLGGQGARTSLMVGAGLAVAASVVSGLRRSRG